ncbi:protein of unknown function [Methylocaldum szegediense]|uniref:30S ribosomal protein S4 n=1 Tax=Methylocaldum szegediense TaxID=73780 RepID=A0ABM9HYL2_9GAMM|nr:protein of unknown function [Methylocaldum szegediense]
MRRSSRLKRDLIKKGLRPDGLPSLSSTRGLKRDLIKKGLRPYPPIKVRPVFRLKRDLIKKGLRLARPATTPALPSFETRPD